MDPFTPGPSYDEVVIERLGPNWRIVIESDMTAPDGTHLPAGSTLTAREAVAAGVQIVIEQPWPS